MEEERFSPDCIISVNPFYERGETSQAPKLANGGGRTPVQNGERAKGRGGGGGGGGRTVDPNCVNASNPFHVCADYCSKRAADVKKYGGKGSLPIHVLRLSPRSSSKGSDGGSDGVQNGVFREEVRKMGDGKEADPKFVDASSPFHGHAEHCSQSTPDAMRQRKEHSLGALLARECEEEAVSRSSKEEQGLIRENGKIDPRCPNASNPFHICADYCHKKISGSPGREGRKLGGSNRKMNIVVERKDVDPRCVNASNPFHKCGDYCFQKIREAT